MRLTQTLLVALVLAPTASAQDRLYVALRQYDYQNRKALDMLTKQVQDAGRDRARLAPIEAGLVAVLQDPKATLAGKQEACQLLWGMGSARSVPALAALLLDPATTNMARYALERNPDAAAATALRAGLARASGLTRLGLISSLGNRRDTQAIPALKGFALSPDPATQEAAVVALGQVGTSAAVAALRSLPAATPGVPTALLQAANGLVAAGKRTEAAGLFEALTRATAPEAVRAGGLVGLAGLVSPRTLSLALGLAQSAPEPGLQRVAGRVLGLLSAPSEVRAVGAAWPKLAIPAQVALLSAWGDRREAGAAGLAREALRSPEAEVRIAAISALARVGGAAAIPALAALAQGGEHAPLARTALARMGGAGVEPALLALLEARPTGLQTAVIQVLGERPSASSVAALLRVAQGTEPRVAVAALKVLERVAPEPQQQSLVSLLAKTEVDVVRDAAQRAVVAVAQRSGAGDRAAEPLLSALDSASVAGKAALLSALAEVGGERAFAVLVAALTSPEGALKEAALTSLTETWGEPSGLPVLLKLAKNEPSKAERVRALRGYLRLLAVSERLPAEQRLAHVAEAMALAERVEERRQALSVLREVRLPGAVTLAAAALASPELVAEATDTVLYLAESQRKDRTTLPAVKGAELTAALEKIVAVVQDEKVRALARKLLQK